MLFSAVEGGRSFPSRQYWRHLNSRLSLIPCSRASCATGIYGRCESSTIFDLEFNGIIRAFLRTVVNNFMDSVHNIWCPLTSQEFQDLPDGAEMTLTIKMKGDELQIKDDESQSPVPQVPPPFNSRHGDVPHQSVAIRSSESAGVLALR